MKATYWLNMNSANDNRRKSLGGGTLQQIPEGTVANHENVQVHGNAGMPSLEQCRYLNDDGQPVDIQKLHHNHHYKTISEREQFEERIKKGTVSMKDIETLQERLVMEKHDDRNVLAGMSDSIEMSGLRKSQRKMSGMQTLFSSTDISASLDKFPVMYDRNPRETFVELEELSKHGEEMEWKETARWIKFEENVEDSNRWGKPHVASLTFHSLLELMKGLEKGTVLLDLEKFDLPSIAEAVVDNMVITDQLKQKDSNKVLAALLLRHRHQHQQGPMNRRTSSKKKPKKLAVGTDKLGYDAQSQTGNGVVGVKINEQKQEDPLALESAVDENENKQESDVKEKIPKGAEATNVLVGTLDELEHSVLAFVRLAKGCHLGEMTEVSIPVRFLFVLLGPSKDGESYHQIGRSIATLMSDQAFHDVAYSAESREDLLLAVNEFLVDTVVLPPGNWDKNVLLPILIAQSRAIAHRRKMAKAASSSHSEGDSSLARTGTFFGGLYQDFKRRGKFYVSDFRDGFNQHTLFTSIFLYFTLFATNIAFGGLLESKTGGELGVTEVIFAASACSILLALFAGQPMMIIGATGPILVFEQSIYEFCKAYDVEFLTWRCWIGFWVMIILFGVVALEGCFLIKYFTRFSEDIFELLISAIFIYEPIALLVKLFKKNPLNRKGSGKYGSDDVKGEPNTALLSTILVLGTFFIAFYVRKIKTSHFLGKRTRRLVSDSGIVIAMLIMGVLDFFLEDKVITPHVAINNPLTDGFIPTQYPNRGWFINPGGMNKSMSMGWIFAAIIPAVFVGILLFLETEMTGVLLAKKEHKLAKGPGFNLDMIVVGILSFGCSLLGLPWMCADTVRSASHVNALSIYSTSHAPGEKPHIITVKEQRISNIIIHLLTGLSILLAPGLHLIPIPIFFGVLLYLGIVSMYGLQMVDRFVMMFMPPKHHPDVPYVRKVRTRKIHCYTIIQVLALAFLVGIKLSPLAPSFPFFIICLIPLRKLLTKFYDEHEIEELDNSESEAEDSDYD
ncbi:band 3 anion transport protein-like isoform X2 [Oculina patagonica]